MARPIEFDENRALTAAMHAFRKLGYSGVSIKTLEAETGLSSGSIYNSFGGKDEVFDRVLAHYNDTVVEKRIRLYLGDSDPVMGLISLFQSLLEEPAGEAFGCLLTNSAVEFPGQGPAVNANIRTGFERFLMAFKATILRLPNTSETEAERMSLRLLAYYQGVLILVRHGYDKAALRDTIEDEITAIMGESNV
jgi:TetR/AcrR family transcriptional regulator, transcriptional repressor for nem operon